MNHETYYLAMAITAMKGAIYRLALTADDDTLRRVCQQLDMVERAVEQAGLHVIKEDA